MIDKKSYLKRWSDKIHQWDTEIDELKMKAEGTKSESSINQIDELQVKKEHVQNKLKQLWEAGDNAWNDILLGLEKSWTEFSDAFSKASAKI